MAQSLSQFYGPEENILRIRARFRSSAQMPLRWLVVGDSNSAAACFTQGCKEWPQLVQTELEAAYATGAIQLLCCAAGGISSGSIPGFYIDMIRSFQPHVCVIALGSDETDNFKAENFTKNIKELITTLRSEAFGVDEIVVMTPVPRMTATPLPVHINTQFTAMVQCIDSIAAVAKQYAVALVDVNEHWIELEKQRQLPIETLMCDNRHPNARGHRLVARLVCEAFGTDGSFCWQRE